MEHTRTCNIIKECAAGMIIMAALCLTAGCRSQGGPAAGRGTEKSTSVTGVGSEYTKTDFVMDTVLSETIYGTEDVTGEIKDILSELEKSQLSWREPDSAVARINEDCSRGKTVKLQKNFSSWVKASLQLAQKSGGAFDPTIGQLTRLWNIEGENPAVPPEEEIQKALSRVGYGQVDITDTNIEETDAKAAAVISMKRGCTLDLGAVGKGIGCDEAMDWLKKDGDTAGAVTAIGGSILVYGQKPDKSAWNVAVQDPRADQGEMMGAIRLEGDHYISTSGDYEKYFEQDGKKYHHILDPRTGYPSDNGLISVTVVCGGEMEHGGLLSDGLSTACFVLGKDEGMKLLEEYGADGIFVDGDKNVYLTDGMKERFSLLNEKYVIKNS